MFKTLSMDKVSMSYHSLTHSHSFTYLERMGKIIIIVVCPKQKIVVFINPYSFNFIVFSLLI